MIKFKSVKPNEVCEYFLNGIPAKARNGSISTSGATLFSYQMAIARWSPVVAGIVELLDFPKGSATTMKHISSVSHDVQKSGKPYVWIPSVESEFEYESGFAKPKDNKYYNFPKADVAFMSDWKFVGKQTLTKILEGYRNPHRLKPKFVEFKADKYRETFLYGEDYVKIYLEETVKIPCSCKVGQYCYRCDNGMREVLTEQNSIVGICFHE